MPLPQTTPIQVTEEIQPFKKRRSLPGMPDPDAEVIVLSPAILLATNRFICEVCNKGFQRDQNLQLHRRGHNLPWKLKQRDENQIIRKRVYVCPEKTCVHHDPTRALGDLTGIKKHFSRKHGEKKWSCERCAKKYAVKSDWKAHGKTCGMKEYGCGCGAVFSRKDSFIGHRAFCDALTQENVKSQTRNFPVIDSDCHQERNEVEADGFSPSSPTIASSVGVLSPAPSVHSPDSPEKQSEISGHQNAALMEVETVATSTTTTLSTAGSTASDNNSATTTTVAALASIFASPASYSDLICSVVESDHNDHNVTVEPASLSSSSSLYNSNTATASLFPIHDHTIHHCEYDYAHVQPALSATGLLETAAHPLVGATSTDASFVHVLPDHCQERTNTSRVGNVGGRFESLMSPSATSTLDFLGLGLGGGSDVFDGGYSGFLEEVGLM